MLKLQLNGARCVKGRNSPFICEIYAIFKNFAGFAAIDKVPSHLLRIKSIKKEDLESTIKNYHPKHHNSCTANYGSNMLARA